MTSSASQTATEMSVRDQTSGHRCPAQPALHGLILTLESVGALNKHQQPIFKAATDQTFRPSTDKPELKDSRKHPRIIMPYSKEPHSLQVINCSVPVLETAYF